MNFKRLAVVLILCLVLFIGIVAVGCATEGVCDSCGQTDTLNTYKNSSGQTRQYCDFCYNMAKLTGN